jgi:hypothetical protein
MSFPLDLPHYQLDGWGGNWVDDDGVEWIVTSEQGWGASAGVRVDLDDRVHADGAWDSPGYEASRIVTLSGTAVAPTRRAQNLAKDRFNAAAGGRGLYPLVVTEEHLTRLAYVRRSGEAKASDRGAFVFDFSITLVAPDPRKYDAIQAIRTSVAVEITGAHAIDIHTPITTTDNLIQGGQLVVGGRTYPRTYPLTYTGAGDPGPTGGGGTPGGPVNGTAALVENTGTRDTGGLIEIRGGLENPVVLNMRTGETLAFGLILTADDVLTVDLMERTVVLNGSTSRRSTIIAGSAWWLFEPGSTWLRLGGTPTNTGNPRMTVYYRSAWK